jgi:nanoRNase/pAp phosphatase (c-di-AMP/oligoRNAs hydrolase)
MTERECFLLLGHRNPDEDCVAALVAFALLLKKFNKDAQIYLSGSVHENFAYLLDISRYNGIAVLGPDDVITGAGFDTVVVCDTAKPEMIDASDAIRVLIDSGQCLVMELDHHLGADSAYIGDEGYRLVAEASSTCELVGYLAVRLRRRKDLLVRYQIPDSFSRNFVLAVLTGIIADSKMGQFLKSRRERRFYRRFSRMFNALLEKTTVRSSNMSDKDQVFEALQHVSSRGRRCYDYFQERTSMAPAVAYVALGPTEMEELAAGGSDNETIVTTARSTADRLAEESEKVGLVAYYDLPDVSDLVQFRVRRSRHFKSYDLRQLLDVFGAHDGGGHEGAIGFRFPKTDIGDFEQYVEEMVERIGRELNAG